MTARDQATIDRAAAFSPLERLGAPADVRYRFVLDLSDLG